MQEEKKTVGRNKSKGKSGSHDLLGFGPTCQHPVLWPDQPCGSYWDGSEQQHVLCTVMSDSLRLHGQSMAPLSMGILQARIVEWVAMPSSRGFSQPRNWTKVSCTAGRFFTIWAPGKPSSSDDPWGALKGPVYYSEVLGLPGAPESTVWGLEGREWALAWSSAFMGSRVTT